jgi:hypothetical protein
VWKSRWIVRRGNRGGVSLFILVHPHDSLDWESGAETSDE